MRLVLQNELNKPTKQSKFLTYMPLIVIIGMILLVTVVFGVRDLENGVFSLKNSMRVFMAGFFLVFSGFKLFDLKGFADGYSTYDLLARKIYRYGFLYPFFELAFGLAYLLNYQPNWTNPAVIIVMGFSGLGVLESLAKRRKFQCACLGTAIKLPLTTVTLIEDFGMAAMAAVNLFLL